MADVLSVHYRFGQVNAYMYTGDSWPVNSLNIDVGIVFIKIWKKKSLLSTMSKYLRNNIFEKVHSNIFNLNTGLRKKFIFL